MLCGYTLVTRRILPPSTRRFGGSSETLPLIRDMRGFVSYFILVPSERRRILFR